MNELIKQAAELRKAIKKQQKQIDTPALIMGILNELDFFIENVE